MVVNGKIALIENKILCNAIWGDTKCVKDSPEFKGYIQAGADEVGRAFIEYCIARVYGIFRLPQCGYDNYLYGRCNYSSLNIREVDGACREMEQVINHIQKMLKNDKRVVDGKASVVRSLSDFQMKDAIQQLNNKDLDEIDIPVSIFSSYSYDGDVTQSYPKEIYGTKHINIKENVNIEDIALWDCYVGNGHQECENVKSMFDEERELWVVDKSINGRKKIKRDKFYYTDGLPSANSMMNPKLEYGNDVPIHDGCYKKRPCEYEDLLTRFVINRNIKKMNNEEGCM